MKILAVSDVVVRSFYTDDFLDRFREVDLILACGDLPPEYLTHLKAKLNKPLLYVKGNHDLRYERKPPAGCRDADGRIVRFAGLNILGLEGSRWYNGGPVQYTEEQMRIKYWLLKPRIWLSGGLDLVMTHAPPRHIHDAEDRCHRGFRVFRKIITKYAPAYFLHGHIHALFDDPEERTTTVGRTRVVNVFGWHLIEIEK